MKFSIITTLLLPGCAVSHQLDLAVAPKKISEILYSDLSRQEMLDRLDPYVRVGQKLKDFTEATGLEPGLCLVGGPSVTDCQSFDTGLQLIADPDGFIRIIRRIDRKINGRQFPQISISSGTLTWKGYVHSYND
ncbi:MAG: hypothetical protein EOP50_04680 [Sphingobacteriales bacterium]|nr:MAG: hypothetical protein EOP50_04680 [Sphingobacteriales bacterium]